MRINSKILNPVRCIAVGLLLITAPAYAEDPVDRSIIFMSASYGYIDYDADRFFKDRGFGGVAMGLHFNRNWSASLFYSRSHPQTTRDDVANRLENYYVQGKYYWRGDKEIRPYVAFGLGEILQGEGKVTSDTAVHTGVGAHWALNPKWAVQLDYRYFYSFNDSFKDHTIMTSLVYRFGDGER